MTQVYANLACTNLSSECQKLWLSSHIEIQIVNNEDIFKT